MNSEMTFICCWCGEKYEKKEGGEKCRSCQGILPMAAGKDPGPEPEPGPRKLPKCFTKKFFITDNVNLKLMLLFTVLPLPFFWWAPYNLIVSTLGLCLLLGNLNILNKEFKALKKGKAVLGRIEKIESFMFVVSLKTLFL